MPVDVSKAKWINVSLDVDVWATDDAPEASRPGYRFIFDMYLTRDRPGKGNVANTLSDEVIIDLDYNPEFPGNQPPGCGVDTKPLHPNVVFDGYDRYEYFYTDHHDAINNKTNQGIARYSTFRRISTSTKLPGTVNILPFLTAIQERWPVANDPLGPWLGQISIGMEIYDHSHGSVNFRSGPQFTVDYKTAPLGMDALLV